MRCATEHGLEMQGPVESPDVEIEDTDPDEDDDLGDAPTSEDEDSATDTAEPDGADSEGRVEDEVAALDGQASTEQVSADAEGHGLTVTDVRVSAHEGFDRITFEFDGGQAAGYDIGYTRDGEAASQGSGEPIDVTGDAALGIALQGVAYPGDADDDTHAWDADRVDGAEGGVILEVVEDTIFEGVHTFFAGLDEEHPFLVERLDDPQRVVIDVHRE
jgi:hypothetical protein